jgi:hypothetical protein
MKIVRFEDIKAWQEARALVDTVYKAVRSDTGFCGDYRFSEQI